MTSRASPPTRRLFPVAAGLVLFYVGVVQCGFALPLLVQAVSFSFEPATAIPTLSLVLSSLGLIGMGYGAAAQRSIAISAGVWLAGCVGTVVGFALLAEPSVRVIAVGVLSLVGGPLAFALVARRVPEPSTPARRELGALLLVVAIGHAFGGIWSFLTPFRMFGMGAMTAGSILGFGTTPAVALVVSALALQAARALLAGHAAAQHRLVLWKWVSIGGSVGLAALSVAGFLLEGRDLPLAILIQPVVSAAVACVLPVVLEQLGRSALAEPLAPRALATVPTVYAWSALWLVPPLLLAASPTRATFVGSFVNAEGVDAATGAILAVGCGLAAILLFATALSVLRAHPAARVLGHLAAVLAILALGSLIYVSLQADRGDYARSLGLPVGLVAVFTAAMAALAWFEGRRETDYPAARVVG